ncbi:MAG: hypothetical protein HQM09_24985 [Candidatus Riflebacteria bacterium]|nr:hypothetical protein [Candidatus Riflebacteria bacterium]
MGRRPCSATPPSWFKITKYNKAKDLELRGWYEQFAIRRLVTSPRCKEMFPGLVDCFLKRIKVNPIISLDMPVPTATATSGGAGAPEPTVLHRAVQREGKFATYLQNIFQRRGTNTWEESAVRPCTVDDYFLFKRLIEPEFLQNTQTAIDNNTNIDATIMDEPIHWHFWFPTSMAFLAVDLSLPDELLSEHFNKIVAKLRKHDRLGYFKNSSNPIKTSIEKWSDNGVLPYIDLVTIWAKENNVRFSIPRIAKTIFPGYGGSEDRIRKETKKLAELVISDKFLYELNAHVGSKEEKTKN